MALLNRRRQMGYSTHEVGWNQLRKPVNFVNTNNESLVFTAEGYNFSIQSDTLTKSISGIAMAIVAENLIANHKYLLWCNHSNTLSSVNLYYNPMVNGSSVTTYSNIQNKRIISIDSNFSLRLGIAINAALIGQKLDIKYEGMNIFDLTLIYGEGNEPTTPEQFERDYKLWIGKELTYEPYDKGSIKNYSSCQILP